MGGRPTEGRVSLGKRSQHGSMVEGDCHEDDELADEYENEEGGDWVEEQEGSYYSEQEPVPRKAARGLNR